MEVKGRSRIGRFLVNRVPILSWLPKYTPDDAICDLIAGVTVGLTLMPQGLAYATLAGLEPQYGLYSGFMGCMVYVVMGKCKDLTIGPTALLALMTYQQIAGRNIDFAVLLCFLTGIVQILMGLLHLGVLIDFISVPVTVGFTSATSVIIATSQLKGLLGLKFESSSFLDTVRQVVTHLPQARVADSALGVSCIAILLLLRKVKDIKLAGAGGKQSRGLWLLSTARNALLVVICSGIAYHCHINGYTPFVLTGTVRSGLPPLQLPPFSSVVNNRTLDFFDMCYELGSSIVLVPIISVLGNVAIAKAFASGDSVDATQELLTLGMCNLLGSFVSSMPITGSFSRSAVNHASGVRTPLGGLYTGLLILLALSVLTPYFYFIPKATLAAVIISAVIFMIEYEVVKPMWRSSRKDLIPTIATFLLCLLLGVEYGILVGVGINILLLLYPSARPYLHVEKAKSRSGGEYLLVTPDNSLYFPAVDFMRARVGRAGVKQGLSHLPVVVDCRYILGADFTAAKGIAALIEDFNRRNQSIYFFNPRPSVLAILKEVCREEFVHICSDEELDYFIHAAMKDPKSQGVEMSEVTSHSSRWRGSKGEVCNGDSSAGPAQEPLLPSNGSVPVIVRSSHSSLHDSSG